MTNKESILKHLVWMASAQSNRPGQRACAEEAAKEYAALLPDWADLPQLLENVRLKRKAENENNPNP